jgi:hypothetical protein
MTRTKVDTYRGFDIYLLEDGTHAAEFGPVKLAAQTMWAIRREIVLWWALDERVAS